MKLVIEVPIEGPIMTDSIYVELEEDELLELFEQLSDEEVEKLLELLKRRREHAKFSFASE